MNSGRFKKGHKTWNKNLKGICLSPNTLFKKGHNFNNKPIGSERINKDDLIEVRVENRLKNGKFWIRKHVLIWQTHHLQSVPDDCLIRFLDGNKRNFDINNLILVTRKENLMLNHAKVNEMPLGIRLSYYLLAKIHCKSL